ncbi:sulfatase-like hydrolase/transferase [Paenibacillus sp. DYY-L-2]|uniref:sulfatase-like hydrolase/transferase n=1 Tax=Paenibacillus sp. DYY-L-2 TaxID=3447013 RepID=UPI003F4F5955
MDLTSKTAAAAGLPKGTTLTEKPNIVYIVLDDMGYSDLGSFGSEIKTPHIDQLAKNGLTYTNFHATPLCSPTRASLFTGRNHHSVGMGSVANSDLGPDVPNTRSRVKHEAGTVSEVLKQNGYNTYGVGKWHQAPTHQATPAGPFDYWPLAKGFHKYYGFLDGYTDQYAPLLIQDNHIVEPPKQDDYHLSEDLIDHSIQYVNDHVSIQPEKPFFLYVGFGAQHAPHQVPESYVEQYKGVYDKGWDQIREDRLARQKKLGIVPQDTKLPQRDPDIKAWSQLSAGEKKVYTRLQETYAGFLTHTDEQIGRLINNLENIGELDNTLIFLISDNGASSSGGETGSIGQTNSNFGDGLAGGIKDRLASYDQIGAPGTYTEYPKGWAQVGNTPLKQYKGTTYEGGVRVPLIVHWPDGIQAKGTIRTQYHHVTDITPTVYESTAIEPPEKLNGIEQMPIHGISFAYSFEDSEAPTKKAAQYYLMNGHRSIWQNDWKAVAAHKQGQSYENDVWELYHLDLDIGEQTNLAERHPDKLAALKKLWEEEATKYGALPFVDRSRVSKNTETVANRDQFTYYPGLKHVGGSAAPQIENTSYDITVPIDRNDGKAEGVLVAFGHDDSGFSLYIKDNRLVYQYNYGGNVHRITSNSTLPSGKVTVRFSFVKTQDSGGIGTLYVNGRESGGSVLPLTEVFASEGLDIGRDTLLPVSDQYGEAEEFPFTGTIEKVVFDLHGEKTAAIAN